MHTDRRGLTVIELVLILLALGLIIFFLFRLRGSDGPVTAGADTAALPMSAAAPLVDRLDLVTPLDSVVSAGDTLEVRLRATGAGAGVARATIELTAEGGAVLPSTVVTNDIGEASVRWVLDTTADPASGTRTLRAAVRDNPAASLVASVRITPTAVPDAR